MKFARAPWATTSCAPNVSNIVISPSSTNPAVFPELPTFSIMEEPFSSLFLCRFGVWFSFFDILKNDFLIFSEHFFGTLEKKTGCDSLGVGLGEF